MNGEDFRSKLREYYLGQRTDRGDLTSRVEIDEEKRINNACSIKIYLEDHTLGNLIRMGLLRHKDVTFSGYRQIHPLQHKIEIKVQTNGNLRPEEAFRQTVQTLAAEMNFMEEEWSKKVMQRESDMMKEEI